MQDEEFRFLHFYIQKGFKLDYLLALKPIEKVFFIASMECEQEKPTIF